MTCPDFRIVATVNGWNQPGHPKLEKVSSCIIGNATSLLVRDAQTHHQQHVVTAEDPLLFFRRMTSSGRTASDSEVTLVRGTRW